MKTEMVFLSSIPIRDYFFTIFSSRGWGENTNRENKEQAKTNLQKRVGTVINRPTIEEFSSLMMVHTSR
jgi:hypothetical protein